ncbi:MAG: AIR synthase related protein, partial [Cucumibacter sp.]
YDRPFVSPAPPAPMRPLTGVHPDPASALLALIGSPALCSRRWIFEQYDTIILGNSLQRPGGDAGVVRIDGHPAKALAFSVDVTPRYCAADSYEGAKQAVAECWRNLTAVGATPLAVSDNLNFGNPERPEIMGQFVHAIKGIGEACQALDFPVVSGNVSLYNETNGVGIPPTPAIAGVGLLPDWSRMARIGFAAEGEPILLAGAPEGWGAHLGQSLYARQFFGSADGAPPNVDLAAERKAGDFVRALIREGIATACHDCSDGGLAVALAEMTIASGIGATIAAPSGDPAAAWFGEDQHRYVLTARNEAALIARAATLGVSLVRIGTTGGASLKLGDARAIEIDDLRSGHEAWFPAFMDARAARAP